MSRVRWLAVVVLVCAGVFAWQGGAYSTADYVAVNRAERVAAARVQSLTREVDSLKRFRRLLETDPATQERVAREQWGWVRPGEMSFIVVPDSVADSARAAGSR